MVFSHKKWTSRINAAEALIMNFGCIVVCLADIIEEKHDHNEVNQAQTLNANLNFQFLLLLIIFGTGF